MKAFAQVLPILLGLGLALPARGASFVAPIGSGGSGVQGGLSNAYSFNGPFSVVNDTNVYLHANISNIVMMSYTNVPVGADLTSTLSNAVNGTTFLLGAGTYTVTPSIVSLYSAGYPSQTRAINLFNKSNLTVVGIPGKTIINGSAGVDNTNNLGEVLLITNSYNLKFHGVTFRGQQLTNAFLYTNNALWAAIGIYKSRDIFFENCIVEDSFDQGIWDIAANSGTPFVHSTNVVIRGGIIRNCGNWRTNISIAHDGTGVIPTGWTIDGVTFENNFRHIEPYDEAGGYPFTGLVIRNCIMRNSWEDAITTAGSTNAWYAVIENNIIYNEPGYYGRGSNGFTIPTAAGIRWNAGQGPTIRNNTIYGMAVGIEMISGSDVIKGAHIVGNTIYDINHDIDGNGQGITIGAASPYTSTKVLGAYVAGNTFFNCEASALQINGTADSTFENNFFYNPVNTRDAFNLDVIRIFDNDSTTINSNLVFRNNRIVDTGIGTTPAAGIFIHAAAKVLRFENNQIQGITGAITNNAGTNVSFITPGTDVRQVYNNGWLNIDTLIATNLTHVTDEAYGVGWDSDLTVPTKNSLYDKIETLGSGATNNVVTGQHFQTVSNQTTRVPMNLADTTNIVLSFRTNLYIVAPSNVFTVTLTDLPNSAYEETIKLYLINTNASAGYFPTNNLNGRNVIMLPPPSTNLFLITSQTNALYVQPGQILAKGDGDEFVMSTNATITTATNVNPTIQDAGGAKITFDFGPSFTAGDSLVLHNTSGLVTNKTVTGSGNYKAFAVVDGTRYEDDGTWYHINDEEFSGNFSSTTSGINGRESWVHLAQGTVPNSVPPLVESGAYGYISLVTSNTATGITRVILDSPTSQAGSILATNSQFVWLCRMRMGNTNVTGEIFTARFGLSNQTGPHQEPSSGCYIMCNTNINTNTFVAVTSRAGSATFNYGVTASATWTNMVWYWVGQRLDSTGTNVISFIGPSPQSLVSFATNSLTIPNSVMIGPFFSNHRILLTTPPLHTTNYWDAFHLWAKPN